MQDPELTNPKIDEVREKHCGVRLPLDVCGFVQSIADDGERAASISMSSLGIFVLLLYRSLR